VLANHALVALEETASSSAAFGAIDPSLSTSVSKPVISARHGRSRPSSESTSPTTPTLVSTRRWQLQLDGVSPTARAHAEAVAGPSTIRWLMSSSRT
jgi:hypothetical protein